MLGVHVHEGTRAGTREKRDIPRTWTCSCGEENPGFLRQCGRVLGDRDGTEGMGIDGGPLKEYCNLPRGGQRRHRGARDIMDLNPTATDFERAKRHDGRPGERLLKPVRG